MGLTGRKRNMLLLLAAFMIAGVFLMICSKNSPLYPMNDWYDVNCFMTVGRAVLDGRLMYVDIYEQKGPLLYFIYALAALVSDKSFIGVFILELICYTVFLFFSLKLSELYLGKLKLIHASVVMSAVALGVVTSFSFAHGGSVEGISLPLLTVTLYLTLKAIRSDAVIGCRTAFLIGCFMACALWIKYTTCGFYFGLCIFIAVEMIRDKSSRPRLIPYILSFLAGIALLSAPIIIYFIGKGALDALFEWYFYNNIVIYTETDGGGALLSIINISSNIIAGLVSMLAFAPAVFIPLIASAVKRRGKFPGHRQELFAILAMFFGTAVFTFLGVNQFPYYSHVFCAFSGLSAVIGYRFAVRIIGKLKIKQNVLKWALPASVLALALLAFPLSSNTYLLKFKRADMPQYIFAEEINKTPDAKLLNYGSLDGGFYFASGTLPDCPFFCRLNLEHPDMDAGQADAALNKSDYIVTIDKTVYELLEAKLGSVPEGVRFVNVKTVEFPFEWFTHTYYLYRVEK